MAPIALPAVTQAEN